MLSYLYKVRPTKIIIPCAGLGTRLLPLSAVIPKELLPIGKWPAVFHTILEAFQAGLKHVVLVVSAEKKDLIRQAFTPKSHLIQALRKAGKEHLIPDLAQLGILERMTLVEQYPLAGLGHAILCAKQVIGDEPFCVALPDEHLRTASEDKNEIHALIQAYTNHSQSCGSLWKVEKTTTASYGIAKLGKQLKNGVCEIHACVEKPPPKKAPSTSAFIGRYLFTPEVWPHLQSARPGMGGEIQLTDAMHQLALQHKLLGHEFEGERIDVGSLQGYYTCVAHYIPSFV